MLDIASRWALPILVIFVLLMVAYSLIYYAAESDRAARNLSQTLPANYRDTLKSIIAATGHPCDSVCAVEPSVVAPGRPTLRVACDVRDTGKACAVTRTYAITVEPAAEPTR
jgi:hypothetical protein